VIHGSYWYRPPNGGKAVRLDRVEEYEEAMARYRLLVGEVRVMDPSEIPRLLWKVKKNSDTRGLEVRLSKEDMAKLWERSQGRCELSGIPFETVQYRHHKKRPWAPSVDRIDSARGYELDNVRLVCAAMNYALNEWGEDVFAKLAVGYVQKNGIRVRKGDRAPKVAVARLHSVPPELVKEFGFDPENRTAENYLTRDDEYLERISRIDPPALGPESGSLDLRRLRAVLYGFKQGKRFPPVLLSRIDGSTRLRLEKGIHRFYASAAVGFRLIPARFTE
jgi:hypothetical protein